MPSLKLVLWNMEWMNDLFGPNDQPPAFKPDQDKTAHNPQATVRQRRDDLSGVLNELAPDLVVVVEGPNRTEELQLFFDHDVQGQWRVQVQPSKGQTQNIGLALRVDQGKFAEPPLQYFDTAAKKEFDKFLVDTDDDEVDEQYKFERRPLYVEIIPQGGKEFRILGLHLKSKGIFQAYEWSKWWQMADANRRKILAQATQLRLEFLDPYLTDPQTKDIPLIVCGDFNDGPGLDASEKRLFGSGVERLMGTIWKPQLVLHNALFDTLTEKKKAKLKFEEIVTTRYKDPIFNDTWHNEWIDHILYTGNPGAPWISGAQVHSAMPDGKKIWEKYKYASDHYPISVTINL
ncbi:MAG: endonuclease/exonuclease/phosphatase family protein [Thermodesulfobacteriota bacterium]